MLVAVSMAALRRSGAVHGEPVGNDVPHLALVDLGGQARGGALVGPSSLGTAQAGVGGLRRGREALGVSAAVPAALLHAADGRAHARAGAAEDRDVEGAVLLRAQNRVAVPTDRAQEAGLGQGFLSNRPVDPDTQPPPASCSRSASASIRSRRV